MLDPVLLLEPAGLEPDLACAFGAALTSGVRVERLTGFGELAGLEPEDLEGGLLVVHEAARDGGRGGLELLEALRRRFGDTPLVFATQHEELELTERAVQAGASDVLILGARLAERIGTLMTKLGRVSAVIARNRRLDEQNERLDRGIRQRTLLVGESPQIRRLREQIESVARIPRPLLIVGERGTGKELVARAIHFASDRRAGSIVTVNCAALGESLLESELFGHERGAFTGAERARAGRFEQADGGTLFLDEIGNMPLPFQQKILRVVEYGTYTRVGADRERKTSARIVAATNADLHEKIENGEFLRDLYDRLAFEVIQVPPLRERPGDLEILAPAFLRQFADEIPSFRGKRLADSALASLRAYAFPGNVRELKNLIERAAYRDTTNEITPEDIGLLPGAGPSVAGGSFKSQVDAFRRALLERALAEAVGNQAEAARRLELSYDQFRHYHRKYLR